MSKILDRDSTVLIDVRTVDEFNSFRIKNSINIDYYSKGFLDSISSFKDKKNIILYCRSEEEVIMQQNFYSKKVLIIFITLRVEFWKLKEKLKFKSLNN